MFDSSIVPLFADLSLCVVQCRLRVFKCRLRGDPGLPFGEKGATFSLAGCPRGTLWQLTSRLGDPVN
jgi:hypothetical protein